MSYDLEEQQEPEQFIEEKDDASLSKEVYNKLKQEKKYELLKAKKQEHKRKIQEKIQLMHNKKLESKHKPTFHRINNENHYVCDNCGEPFKEKVGGSLITNNKGEFAYCKKCMKDLYPTYKPVFIANTMSKTDFFSNHADLKYSKGFK